jgi:hypothetical protein
LPALRESLKAPFQAIFLKRGFPEAFLFLIIFFLKIIKPLRSLRLCAGIFSMFDILRFAFPRSGSGLNGYVWKMALKIN